MRYDGLTIYSRPGSKAWVVRTRKSAIHLSGCCSTLLLFRIAEIPGIYNLAAQYRKPGKPAVVFSGRSRNQSVLLHRADWPQLLVPNQTLTQ